MFKHLIYGIGPIVFFAASFVADYARLSILKAHAVQNDLPIISTNPFKSSSSVMEVRKSLPVGPIFKRVRFLEIASAIGWFGFAGLIFIPLWNEYLAK